MAFNRQVPWLTACGLFEKLRAPTSPPATSRWSCWTCAGEDLTLLYLRTGRTAGVKRLAEEIIPIFTAQDVHREAVAALRLFQEAARQEQLTVQTVQHYVKYLREARTDPSLRFPPAQSS